MKWHPYQSASKTNPFSSSRGLRSAAKCFLYHPHQNKERAYVEALRASGYRGFDTSILRTRILFGLFDLDYGPGGVGFGRQILRLHDRGIPVFMYPHCARPMVIYDDRLKAFPHTKAAFTIAPGHVEVMRRIGYPIPMEVVGWPYCEIKPFQPVEQVRNILYGPIHPNANGWLSPVDKDLNRRTHQRLVEYCRETGAQLTVRHVRGLELSGLTPAPGVTYIQVRPDGTHAEIDAADLVVGHQTFAWIAVARGKPVLMMGEDVPPRIGSSEVTFRYVTNWEAYADYLMYPLDILAGDTAELIEQVCKRNAKVTTWRKRFIGEPFDEKLFVERLESYL